MFDEERLARDLNERLSRRTSSSGVTVALDGSGVHWRVDVRTASRRALVHCFWYGPAAGLMLGMNPANARASYGMRRKPRQGAEYLVVLFAGGERAASSRTHDVDDVVAAVDAWAGDRPIGELEAAWPFVNAILRRLERVRTAVETHGGDTVRSVIDPDRTELSLGCKDRLCRVAPDDEGDGCSFYLRGVQVAFGDITNDPATAITRWLGGATLAELAGLGIAIERHAELWERDEHQRWHWMHVRDRIANPDDVLAPLRPLIEKLAESPIATQFYSFSSLSRFCFSACSQYPWITEGLPVISGIDSQQRYVVEIDHERTACSMDEAVALIERVLAAYPIRPFRGSANDRT